MPRLDDLFASGTLVRPTDSDPNLVHLVRAIATLAGVRGLEVSPPVQELVDLIGPVADRHLVFVLLDGLGMNLVRSLPLSSFIASHLRGQLNSTCPSTTACALTSVATGEYPNRHAVTGWFTHLPEFELTAMILPFAERATGQPLTHRGIWPDRVFPMAPLYPRMATHKPTTFVPEYIANTTYNAYSRGGAGGATGRGYESLAHCIDQVILHVSAAAAPTYTHVYLHDIDTLCHHVGVGHESVVPLVLGIDDQLARLARALAGRATIVVSADHGLIDVPKPDQTLLMAGDPMLDLLVVPPSGDARMPIFHVREGRHAAFAGLFRERFDDRMVLVDVADAERLDLFGPGPMTETARRRFGDFIAFPYKPATLSYHPPHKPVGDLYLAVHAGLSPQEMRVPLCVA